MPSYRALKGFQDILPHDAPYWEWIESIARSILNSYGFSRIQTPILETNDLFTQSIGTTTDIVEKEMYTFSDLDQKKISLRPEGTASVVRAYLEHPILSQQPCKLYYIGPMFRHERPQAGRLRQFHQIGVEVIGEISPQRDIEILSLLVHLFEEWKIDGLTLEINSLGCQLCRPPYRQKLIDYLSHVIDSLCQDCLRRFNTNPLRILDCKKEGCRAIIQNAPASLDHLCDECQIHFAQVETGLRKLEISYMLNRHLVRGIDYYTKTAFEMTTKNLGAQNAVAAGGRYDRLVEILGGPPTPAIGFAVGLERVLKLIPSDAILEPQTTLFMVPLGEMAYQLLSPTLYNLRKKKIRSDMGDKNKNLKNQLKLSDRIKAQYVLIVGDEEIKEGKGILRNMSTHHQEKVPLSNLVENVIQHIQTIPPF